MELFKHSHHRFNCMLGNNILHKNVNIYFACNYIKLHQDEEFINKLVNMEVCTFISRVNDKDIKLFKL